MSCWSQGPRTPTLWMIGFQALETICLCFPRSMSRELDQQQNSWNSNQHSDKECQCHWWSWSHCTTMLAPALFLKIVTVSSLGCLVSRAGKLLLTMGKGRSRNQGLWWSTCPEAETWVGMHMRTTLLRKWEEQDQVEEKWIWECRKVSSSEELWHWAEPSDAGQIKVEG